MEQTIKILTTAAAGAFVGPLSAAAGSSTATGAAAAAGASTNSVLCKNTNININYDGNIIIVFLLNDLLHQY